MGLLDAARLDLVKSTEEYIAAVHTRWEVGDTTESYRYHLHQTRQALVEAVQVLRLAQELGS